MQNLSEDKKTIESLASKKTKIMTLLQHLVANNFGLQKMTQFISRSNDENNASENNVLIRFRRGLTCSFNGINQESQVPSPTSLLMGKEG